MDPLRPRGGRYDSILKLDIRLGVAVWNHEPFEDATDRRYLDRAEALRTLATTSLIPTTSPFLRPRLPHFHMFVQSPRGSGSANAPNNH